MKKLLGYVWTIILDFFALCAFVFTYLINFTRWNPKKKASQTPVLLVHGYLHNSSAWIFFRNRLNAAGIGDVYTVNLGKPLGSIEHHAKTIQRKLKEVEEISGRDDIILVGHSMGGLASAYYATHLARPGTVKKVITLGSPLHGSKLGYLGFHHVAKQMRVGSEFTSVFLERMKVAKHIQFLHIGSRYDLFVIPHNSCFVQDESNHRNTEFVLGHLSLLFSSSVLNAVIKHIRGHISP